VLSRAYCVGGIPTKRVKATLNALADLLGIRGDHFSDARHLAGSKADIQHGVDVPRGIHDPGLSDHQIQLVSHPSFSRLVLSDHVDCSQRAHCPRLSSDRLGDLDETISRLAVGVKPQRQDNAALGEAQLLLRAIELVKVVGPSGEVALLNPIT
jgi:hypothetical protein